MMNNYLVCLDLDNTISSGDSHKAAMYHNDIKYLPDDIPNDPQKALEFLHEPENKLILNAATPKNKNSWLQAIREIISNNDNLAITSFNHFPRFVKPILTLLGLKDEEISKIHIESWLPCDATGVHDKNADKTTHINNAIKYFYQTEDNYDDFNCRNFYHACFLVDDRTSNYEKALELGISAILAPKDPDCNDDYIKELISRLRNNHCELSK